MAAADLFLVDRYVYNATLPVHPTGDYRYWMGVVPGDRSDLIANEIHPWEAVPKVFDPPAGWLQNCNDTPWTCAYPKLLESDDWAAGFAPPTGITQRAQRTIRMLSSELPEKMSFEDVCAGKLSTRMETADQFVDDLVEAAEALGGDRARQAAAVLAAWDRKADAESDGALLFYRWMTAAGAGFSSIGGFEIPNDDRRPLDTPRGFADPAQAVAALESVAEELESEYGSLSVPWGEVLRFARDNDGESCDFPGNGVPSQLGGIRTVSGPFVDGRASAGSGDTYFAVVEFSKPVRARALLSYGNCE